MSFSLVSKIHEIIKIYNSDGFDYATHIIDYYSPNNRSKSEEVRNIKAYSYNLIDGKVKKEKLSSNNIFIDHKNKYWATKTFTMPNIKAGTTIEYSYTISSPYFDIRDLKFQYEIPIKQLVYSTEIPEYFNYSKQNTGYYYITPTIKKLSKSIRFTNKYRNTSELVSSTTYNDQQIDHISELTTYISKDIPALKDNEPYISNIDNYRGAIKYELSSTKFPDSPADNYSTNWESVCKTIYSSPDFGTELGYSNYFKNDLENLLKDKTSNFEKTASIFNFVKAKIKWNGYPGMYTDRGVRKAYKEGTGNIADINLMLVSMLREAGLLTRPIYNDIMRHIVYPYAESI